MSLHACKGLNHLLWECFSLLTLPSVPSAHAFCWPASYWRLQCRDTCSFLWNLRKFVAKNTWLNHPGALLIQRADMSCDARGLNLHECVCIYKTHNQWRSAGVWENVRKQQLLLLRVWTLCRCMSKRAKTGNGAHAFVPMLWLSSWALANFSEVGQLRFEKSETRQWTSSLGCTS